MKTMRLAVLALLALAGIGTARAEDGPEACRVAVYVGTYTGPRSDGIYRFVLDLATGAASVPTVAAKVVNPSFIAIHPTGAFLLAENQDSGTIVIFKRDAATGKLTATGHVVEVGSPVCVRFLPIAK